MTSGLAARSAAALEVRGDQTPRILSVPRQVSSAGAEAVELAAQVGLTLDPWQQLVLEQGLGERPDGRWSAFEVAVIVSRQNGKGAILEARELAGLFLFGEQLILHSAHEFKTAQEAFRRILALVEGADWLRRRVRRVRTSHGEEGIELVTGQRLRFIARSTGSGRGFSGDCVILDEAFHLDDEAVAALLPTMSARPNPQLWYTSSAGMRTSTQLARVRRRGHAGGEPGLAFFEWSIAADDDPSDPVAWARANPGLGIRINPEFVAREQAAMDPATFARERLGVGEYPGDGSDWQVIPADTWNDLADTSSQVEGVMSFAADVTPDRSAGAIAVAGHRPDGHLHVEVIDARPGTGWMVDRIVGMVERWAPCATVVDAAGPAGSLIAPLTAAGIEVITPSSREAAQACGQFYDAVTDTASLRHLDQAPLNVALAGAQQRPLGEAWAWTRKGGVDISPLVAVTLAAWGLAVHGRPDPPTDPLDNIW
jgi:hypothetical protein